MGRAARIGQGGDVRELPHGPFGASRLRFGVEREPTCSKCHNDVDRQFAASYTHKAAALATNPVNRWIRYVYVVLITLIIGGMVLHNLVIMNYFMLQRRKEEAATQWVLRFDRLQIAQHLLLTVAFILLVITGFALRFPDAWWSNWLEELGMTESVRQNVHRVAAVLLILVSVSHAYYVLVTERGKREFRAMMPRWRDFGDLLRNLRFYTWRTDKEARFGRYDYSQKAEYWALIWGTIIMMVTGLILWFPELTTRVLPASSIRRRRSTTTRHGSPRSRSSCGISSS